MPVYDYNPTTQTLTEVGLAANDVKDELSFTFSLTGLFNYPEIVTIPNTVTSLTSNNIRGFTGHEEIQEVKFEEGSTITALGSGVFASCISLQKIVLPNSILTITGNTFERCTSLETVTLPSGLTQFSGSSGAFYGCSALKSIDLPDTVTELTTAFRDSGLETVTIPPLVTTLQANAFYNCTALENVTLHENITAILNFAFYHTVLENIEFPSSLSTLGAGVFQSTALKSVKFNSCPKASSTTSSDNGYWSATNNNNPLARCTNLEEFTVADGVTWIYNLYLSFTTKLTHDSLVSLIEHLYDYTGGTAHTLTIGAANLAKLSSTEVALATSKNWTVT